MRQLDLRLSIALICLVEGSDICVAGGEDDSNVASTDCRASNRHGSGVAAARDFTGAHTTLHGLPVVEIRMKFSLMYELQLPRPWTDLSELELFDNALEEIEEAD